MTANSERICSIVSTLSTWNCQPSDREKADIVPLANRFLRQYGDIYNKTNLRFSYEGRRSSPACLGMAISESFSTPSRKP